MKTMFKLLGIIAIAAVIGFSMLSCGSPSGGGGGGNGGGNGGHIVLPPMTEIPQADRNPPAPSTITTSAATIPNLPTAILDRDDVTPMTKDFLEEMFDDFNNEFQQRLSLSRGASFNRNAVYSRAIANRSAFNESNAFTLKQLVDQLPEDILNELSREGFNISDATLNGYVRYAVSAASADFESADFEFPLHALADTKFFIKTPGVFDTNSHAGVIGEVAGVGDVNIRIQDLDRISGSLAANVSFAVNVLFPIYDHDFDYFEHYDYYDHDIYMQHAYQGSMWVKLIGNASVSSNLASTGSSSITARLNIKAFGENNAEIGALDLTGTVSMTGNNINITVKGSILGENINESEDIRIND